MKRNLKIAIKRAQTELARRMPSVSDLRKKWLYLILLAISANALADMGGAAFLHISRNEIPAPAEPDTIRPRFSVKRTAPRDEDDLKKRSLDLKDPDNLKTDTVYDPATGNYTIGTKVGDSYLNAPLLMSPEEYLSLMEEVEDAKLLRLAESRLQNFTPAETIPAEDVYQKYGITDADLADFDEVELE